MTSTLLPHQQDSQDYEETLHRLREAEYNYDTAKAVYEEASMRLEKAWLDMLEADEYILRQAN